MIRQLLLFFVLTIFLATPTYGLMKRETNRLKYQNMYRQKNTNIRLLRYTCGKYNKIKLLRSGDIELNPGPEVIYKLLTQIFTKQNRKLKFFNINCQSLNKKRSLSKTQSKTLEKILSMESPKHGFLKKMMRNSGK